MVKLIHELSSSPSIFVEGYDYSFGARVPYLIKNAEFSYKPSASRLPFSGQRQRQMRNAGGVIQGELVALGHKPSLDALRGVFDELGIDIENPHEPRAVELLRKRRHLAAFSGTLTAGLKAKGFDVEEPAGPDGESLPPELSKLASISTRYICKYGVSLVPTEGPHHQNCFSAWRQLNMELSEVEYDFWDDVLETFPEIVSRFSNSNPCIVTSTLDNEGALGVSAFIVPSRIVKHLPNGKSPLELCELYEPVIIDYITALEASRRVREAKEAANTWLTDQHALRRAKYLYALPNLRSVVNPHVYALDAEHIPVNRFIVEAPYV